MQNETITTIKSTISFEGTGVQVLDALIKKIVGFINTLIEYTMPQGGGIYIVALIAILWAFLIKKRWQLGYLATICYALVFFCFMRYFNIGG